MESFSELPWEVENSEVSKKRVALEKRLSNIQRWAVSAETRAQRASKLCNRLWQLLR